MLFFLIYFFNILKIVKIIKLDRRYFYFPSILNLKTFSEKIPENNDITQKLSGSLTISRQRYIKASRQRVYLGMWRGMDFIKKESGGGGNREII